MIKDFISANLPDRNEFFKLWRLSWPIMVTNVLQILIIVVDTFMVGRLGPDAIAAIGMGNAIRLFLFILVLSVSSGSISLMSQSFGTGDPGRMSKVLKQSLIAGFLVSLLIGVIGMLLSKPVLQWMDNGDSTVVIDEAYAYLLVIFAGLPFLMLNLVSERLMQGAGDTIAPMVLTGLTVVINIFLNYIFIFGYGGIPGFGVVGAAFGTILSRAIILAVYLFMFRSRHYHIGFLPGHWRPDLTIIRSILAIGIPSGLQGIFRRGSALFLIGLITATELGTLGAAALTIGWQIESVIVQILVGINIAGTAMVGFWIGRWQLADARRTGNALMLLGFCISLVLIVPILLYPEPCIALFDPSYNQDIIRGTKGFIYTSVLTLPVAAVSIISTGALRGAGDTKPPMYSTIWFRCIFTLAAAYIMAFVLDYGFMGIWYAMVGGRVLDTLYMIYLWRAKKWIKVALHGSPLYIQHLQNLPTEIAQRFLTHVRMPLLSDRSVSEIIKEDKVIYRSSQLETKIAFDARGYNVLPETKESK